MQSMHLMQHLLLELARRHKFSATAFATISAPGSEMHGNPASLTSAIFFPSRK